MSAGPPAPDGEQPEDAAGADRPEERRRVDVEAAWADIVAHWDAEPPEGGTWPAPEDAGPSTGPAAPPHAPGAPSLRGTPSTGGRDDLEEWWGAGQHPPGRHRLPREGGRAAGAPTAGRFPDADEDADEDADGDADGDDRYTPPEPPPLARGGWRSWLPWVGVLGAPVFFAVFAVARLALPGLLLLAVVAAFVAGFVTLVLRLPAHRGEDDDDGAVV